MSSPLSTDLRTRRFNRPTFGLTRHTNHWKNTAFRDYSNIWRGCIFFLLTFALLHLLSADLTTLLCFSTVHIVGSFYLNFLRLEYGIGPSRGWKWSRKCNFVIFYCGISWYRQMLKLKVSKLPTVFSTFSTTYPVILRILGFSAKIHHPWLRSSFSQYHRVVKLLQFKANQTKPQLQLEKHRTHTVVHTNPTSSKSRWVNQSPKNIKQIAA